MISVISDHDCVAFDFSGIANRAQHSGMWGRALLLGSVALELSSGQWHHDFPVSVLSAEIGVLPNSQFYGVGLSPSWKSDKGCSVSYPNPLLRGSKLCE